MNRTLTADLFQSLEAQYFDAVPSDLETLLHMLFSGWRHVRRRPSNEPGGHEGCWEHVRARAVVFVSGTASAVGIGSSRPLRGMTRSLCGAMLRSRCVAPAAGPCEVGIRAVRQDCAVRAGMAGGGAGAGSFLRLGLGHD